MLKLALTLTLGVSCAFAFYSETLVTKLTEDNFKKEVVKDKNSVWIIEFYSPYCGLAKAFKPHFEKVAESLKGMAKVGAVPRTQMSPTSMKKFRSIPHLGSSLRTRKILGSSELKHLMGLRP